MGRPTILVPRLAPRRLEPSGVLRVGAAEVDLAPPLNRPTAGYSLGAPFAERVLSPLRVRAFTFEGADGAIAAFAIVDLQSASRYLHAKVAEATASIGVSAGELVLAGTHTHTGPGSFFGSSLYDTLASSRPGFDRALADGLAERIADAVRTAHARAEPAALGVGVVDLWGASRNASPRAFAANPEAASWNAPGLPGESAPPGLDDAQRSVDPRVVALVARAASSGRCIGVLGVFAMHATALGEGNAVYGADWPGHAVEVAREQLAEPDAVVAIAQSGTGDANALTVALPQGEELVRERGARVGAALALAAVRANCTTHATIETRFGEPLVEAAIAEADPSIALAPACFGVGALAGGEDARSPFFRAGLVRPGRVGSSFPAEHPQHPKVPAFGLAQRAIVRVLDLATAPVFPLHVVRIGGHVFATIPGEPTAVAAHRIERRLLAETGASGATILGYAGDYMGYFTTREEYELQEYEGASTLFGRNSVRLLEERIAQVVRGELAAAREGLVAFAPGRRR